MKLTTKMLESLDQARLHTKKGHLRWDALLWKLKNNYMWHKRTAVGDEHAMASVRKVGETMFLHKAIKELDKEEFVKSMAKEVMTHKRCKHWKLRPIFHISKFAHTFEI